MLSSSLQLRFRRSRPPVLFDSVSRLKVLAGQRAYMLNTGNSMSEIVTLLRGGARGEMIEGDIQSKSKLSRCL